MFIPFLPLFFAFFVLGLLFQTPGQLAGDLSFSPWIVIFFFLTMSVLIGQIPPRYLGERTAIKFTPRRMMVLILWGLMIYGSRLDLELMVIFQSLPFFKSEFSFFSLLLIYWFGDALCINLIQERTPRGFLLKIDETLTHLRLQLPILLLIALQFAIFQIVEHVFLEFPSWQQSLITFCCSCLIMVTGGPYLIVTCWGAGGISSKDAEQTIQTELHANQISGIRILRWPEQIISVASAGIFGFVPGFRYLLISEQLIRALSFNELRAVIAHEAGHLRRHHLLYFFVGFIAFSGLLILSWRVVYGFQWLFVRDASPWPYILITVLGFFLFIRIILGFLSRNFERQADCHSLECVGFHPLKQALLKVAWLNGIDPQEDNWHHYGIQQRLQFLSNCLLMPNLIQLHHQRVFKIKHISGALAALCLTLNIGLMSESIQLSFFQFLLSRQLQSLEQINSEDHLLLRQLTDLATRYQFNSLETQAEPIYRKILEFTPNHAVALNNLAWLLATNYADYPEKIEEAIELALLAVAVQDSAFVWDTLAESYSQFGNYQQASQAAQRALELAQQGIGTSSYAGLDYYQERSLYFRQFVETAQ